MSLLWAKKRISYDPFFHGAHSLSGDAAVFKHKALGAIIVIGRKRTGNFQCIFFPKHALLKVQLKRSV